MQINLVYIGEDLPIFDKISRKLAIILFGLSDIIFHDKILLNPIRLKRPKNPLILIILLNFILSVINEYLQMLNSMSKFHKLLTFRLLFEVLDFLYDFLKQWHHIVIDQIGDGYLVKTKLFLLLAK